MYTCLHGGLVSSLPLKLCYAAVIEAAHHFLLQDLTEVVYMTPGLAVGGEQVAPLLSLHLNIPHLHLVLGHVRPEREQPRCSVTPPKSGRLQTHCCADASKICRVHGKIIKS